MRCQQVQNAHAKFVCVKHVTAVSRAVAVHHASAAIPAIAKSWCRAKWRGTSIFLTNYIFRFSISSEEPAKHFTKVKNVKDH